MTPDLGVPVWLYFATAAVQFAFAAMFGWHCNSADGAVRAWSRFFAALYVAVGAGMVVAGALQ